MKAPRMGIDMALLILKLGAGLGWVAFTKRQLLYPGKEPEDLLHCTWDRSGQMREKKQSLSPRGFLTPNHSDRSKWLCRLRYPGPYNEWQMREMNRCFESKLRYLNTKDGKHSSFWKHRLLTSEPSLQCASQLTLFLDLISLRLATYWSFAKRVALILVILNLTLLKPIPKFTGKSKRKGTNLKEAVQQKIDVWGPFKQW
jgi:hypothetical protein